MPTWRVDAAAAVLDGRIHVIGGTVDDLGEGYYVAAHEVFDPVARVLFPRAPLPTSMSRLGAGAVALDGRRQDVGVQPALVLPPRLFPPFRVLLHVHGRE